MDKRIPPGQRVTAKFPVLHYGTVPDINLEAWSLRVFGLVENELNLSRQDVLALPVKQSTLDIHCVTGWSKLGTAWQGFCPQELVELAKPQQTARYVMLHAPNGWSTNLPVEEFLAPGNLFAYSYEGQPLTPEHGWPLRFTLANLYFWKGAKWVTGVEFMQNNKLGFWEQNGYHAHGDPWKSERYSF